MRYGQFAFVGVALFGLSQCLAAPTLPRVDLGYEIHEALSFNETTQLFKFGNIPYAKPPVGELRFKAPVAPDGRNQTVQKNAENRICPQAVADWGTINAEFGQAFNNGSLDSYNHTLAAERALPNVDAIAAIFENMPGVTEDCLVLDVVVPKAIFERKKRSKGAPVFVWIHGGAYTWGHKADPLNAGEPSGLIAASQADGSDGIVYVAINYRIGAFGFLAGPSLVAAAGDPNAGLHDQRLALEWVQQNIHLFGGDPAQVTVGGLSAGGGSLMHHLTAYGGLKGSVPFARGYSHSAGFLPVNSHANTENATQTFFDLLGVNTVEEARALPFEDLRRVNMAMVRAAPTSTYVWGPVVDGAYVPALPGNSLLAGNFDHNVTLLLSHTTFEAGEYAPGWVETDDDFRRFLRSVQPTASEAVIDYIISELYPEEGHLRTIDFVSDYGFSCLTNFLAKAYCNNTWNIEYSIAPAFHGYDMKYLFFGAVGGVALGGEAIPEIAKIVQGYVTNFVKGGDPNGVGLPAFPVQGTNASINVITEEGVEVRPDSTVGERCTWLQKGLLS